MEAPLVLPGDQIPESLLPPMKPSALKLSPGLLPSRSSPTGITPTVAGTAAFTSRRALLTLAPLPSGGRYVPHLSDLVIAQVHHSGTDFYHCNLAPHTPFALLPHLAFEGATRRTRPQLAPNALVYARITKVAGGEVEIQCVNPATGKRDGLGPLEGGCVFDVSLGFARRLMLPEPATQGGVVVLEELAQRLQKEGRGGFEVAVARNGKVWIDAEEGNIKTIVGVGRCLRETDEGQLGTKQQKALVDKVAKSLGK